MTKDAITETMAVRIMTVALPFDATGVPSAADPLRRLEQHDNSDPCRDVPLLRLPLKGQLYGCI